MMPDSANFNVAVLVSLRQRVSQGLRALAQDFGSAQRRVTSLQRSLNDLQTRHGIYAQRARVTQAVERDTTSSLQGRLATMQQIAASEQNVRQARIDAMKAEAEERGRMGRIQAEQFRGLQRRTALQRVASREASDAQRIQFAEQQLSARTQARQLQMSEVQGRIARRNAVAQIRATEAENRLLREQNAIRDRQAALSAERGLARRARLMSALKVGGGIALAGGAAAYEVTKAGLPVGMYLQQIAQGGRLTPQQSAMLPQMALQMSTQATQFTYKDVLKALRQLIPMYGFNATQTLAPSIFALAGLERERGLGTDLTQMSTGVAQTLAALHAGTAKQQREVLNTLTTLLFRTGGAVSPESMEGTLRTMASASIKMPFAKQLRAGAMTSLIMAEAGSQPHLSASNVASLFRALLTPHLGAQMGLLQLMTPAGRRAVSQGHVLSAVEMFPKGLTLPQRFLGGNLLPVIYALQQAMGGNLLSTVRTQLSTQISPQQALAQSLNTAAPAMRSLGTSLDNFVTVMGAKIAQHTAKPSGELSSFVGRSAKFLQSHSIPSWYVHTLNEAGLSYLRFYQNIGQVLGSGYADAMSPPALRPFHVSVHLDGKKVYEGVTKHANRNLRQSAMSNVKARGPAASPYVYSRGPW